MKPDNLGPSLRNSLKIKKIDSHFIILNAWNFQGHCYLYVETVIY